MIWLTVGNDVRHKGRLHLRHDLLGNHGVADAAYACFESGDAVSELSELLLLSDGSQLLSKQSIRRSFQAPLPRYSSCCVLSTCRTEGRKALTQKWGLSPKTNYAALPCRASGGCSTGIPMPPLRLCSSRLEFRLHDKTRCSSAASELFRQLTSTISSRQNLREKISTKCIAASRFR